MYDVSALVSTPVFEWSIIFILPGFHTDFFYVGFKYLPVAINIKNEIKKNLSIDNKLFQGSIRINSWNVVCFKYNLDNGQWPTVTYLVNYCHKSSQKNTTMLWNLFGPTTAVFDSLKPGWTSLSQQGGSNQLK